MRSVPETSVVWGVVFLALMRLSSGSQLSATVDEMAHLPAGISIWQLNRFELYRVNPPLVKMVAAAPVMFMDPVTDWSYALPLPG